MKKIMFALSLLFVLSMTAEAQIRPPHHHYRHHPRRTVVEPRDNRAPRLYNPVGEFRFHVYGELGYYSNIPSLKEEYFKLQRLYRDSLFSIIDHRDPIYLMYRVYQLQEEKRMEEARKLSDQWVKQLSPDSRDYAIACYYRSLSSDTDDDRKTWLAQSALSDVRHAVMDQASLLALS